MATEKNLGQAWPLINNLGDGTYIPIVEISGGGTGGGAPSGSVAITITSTLVAVSTSSSVVIAANPNRKYLAIQNIGLNHVNLGFSASAILNQGWAIDPAAAIGRQGGALSFEPLLVTQEIRAIAPAATTLIVLEGV